MMKHKNKKKQKQKNTFTTTAPTRRGGRELTCSFNPGASLAERPFMGGGDGEGGGWGIGTVAQTYSKAYHWIPSSSL